MSSFRQDAITEWGGDGPESEATFSELAQRLTLLTQTHDYDWKRHTNYCSTHMRATSSFFEDGKAAA